MHVAIVGTGPSGFYALQAMSRATDMHFRVDLYDRLPTPFGLVRGGIAPDHPQVKAVSKVYDRLARLPYVRFCGGVRIGTDIDAIDLALYYDAVIWAVGCESERRLGIPGEDLLGVHSATEFVFWYNGHPEFRERNFDLAGARRAVVIGNGNVAVDVARILARDPSELATTDIASHALDVLRTSALTEISLLGRRGPAQAAFTAPELRELAELTSADLTVEANREDLTPSGDKRLDMLRAVAERPRRPAPRTVRMRFCVSPVAILGHRRVEAIRLVRNRLERRGDGYIAVPVGDPWDEPVDLVYTAVGYRGIPVPGVPFDAERGHIPNAGGRVVGRSGKRITGHYVVGWAKRGPSGVVGTNKPDAEETVLAMLADFGERTGQTLPDVDRLLSRAGITPVDWAGWTRIDAAELRRGQALGKVREKFTSVSEMVSVAQEEE